MGLSSVQYNAMYTVYAWTNAFVVIIAGLMVDKLGNRLGLILFTSFCLVGSAMFALVRKGGSRWEVHWSYSIARVTACSPCVTSSARLQREHSSTCTG